MRTDRPDDAASVAQVVERLMRLRTELGKRAFRHAVERTLHAIGTAALTEAECRAARPQKRSKPRPRNGNVVRFPGPKPPEPPV